MTLASIPFIFLFFPFFLLLYYVIPLGWWRKVVLIIGSLFFIVWLDPNHVHVFVFSVLINYLIGLVISRVQHKHHNSQSTQALTVFGVLLNLGLLVFYKYSSLILTSLSPLLKIENPFFNNPIIPPLGISYLTFNAVSYLVDVYQQIVPAEKNLLNFSCFLLMFPKLTLGPITRYNQIKDSFSKKWFQNPKFINGLRRFVIGLGKKLILADNLAIIVNKVFEADYSTMNTSVAWFGLLAFTLQIYYDFCGYTDMAIGIGIMLGYQFPENFNFPYMARSISDFWRRWHMTLTNWFRTYLFLPLELKRKNAGAFRQPVNIIIVFIATGIWHGASWNFLIWGGYYGVLLTIEAMGFGKILKRIPVFFQHLLTMLFIIIGWVFFKITNIASWGKFLSVLIGLNQPSGEITLRSMNILLFVPLLIIGAFFTTSVTSKFINESSLAGKIILALSIIGIFFLSISYLLANGYQPFLYAQF